MSIPIPFASRENSGGHYYWSDRSRAILKAVADYVNEHYDAHDNQTAHRYSVILSEDFGTVRYIGTTLRNDFAAAKLERFLIDKFCDGCDWDESIRVERDDPPKR